MDKHARVSRITCAGIRVYGGQQVAQVGPSRDLALVVQLDGALGCPTATFKLSFSSETKKQHCKIAVSTSAPQAQVEALESTLWKDNASVCDWEQAIAGFQFSESKRALSEEDKKPPTTGRDVLSTLKDMAANNLGHEQGEVWFKAFTSPIKGRYVAELWG